MVCSSNIAKIFRVQIICSSFWDMRHYTPPACYYAMGNYEIRPYIDLSLGFVCLFDRQRFLSPEHLVVLLAGPISHTSSQYMDFVEIFNALLELSTIVPKHLRSLFKSESRTWFLYIP